jgi:hypothetical protein
MSSWTDGAKLLQKIITAKEVVPIQSDLIDLQQLMFASQTDQMKLMDENAVLRKQVSELQKRKEYVYQEDHTWLIHPGRPDIKLCPVCMYRDGFESPTVPAGGRQYCMTCKKELK